MAQQLLTVTPQTFVAGSGSPLKPEFDKVNANFTELYAGVGTITGQGVAVANATDAPSVITQLNALLATLRTKGVIAT